MARVFKPTWTQPLPKDGRYYTKNDVRYCEFTSRGKKKVGEVVVIKGVEKLRIESEVWYCEYKPHDQRKPKQVKSGKDRRNAESHLARLIKEDDDRRVGRAVPDGSRLGQTMGGWKEEYLQVLRARGRDRAYIELGDTYLDAMLSGCGWKVWADVGPDRLLLWLHTKRETDKIGPATLNSYLRVMKAFTNWLAARLKTAPPLRGKALPPFNEQVDRRRSKRILTDDEFNDLVHATERCPRRAKGFGGKARALLYRMAAHTGLRASELAALRPIDLDLDAEVPHVRPQPGETKGKRDEPLPLPEDLVEDLRKFAAGKDPKAPLWPGTWATYRRQVKWLKRDLARAGIRAEDDRGRNVTFHSLRRRFVKGIIDAGGDINRVKRLSRHRDLKTTLEYYTDSDLPSLAELSNRLPKLKKKQQHQPGLFDHLF